MSCLLMWLSSNGIWGHLFFKGRDTASVMVFEYVCLLNFRFFCKSEHLSGLRKDLSYLFMVPVSGFKYP